MLKNQKKIKEFDISTYYSTSAILNWEFEQELGNGI